LMRVFSPTLKSLCNKIAVPTPLIQRRSALYPIQFSFKTMVARYSTKKKSTKPLQDFLKDGMETANLSVAPYMIPDDSKRRKGGEDAYFISKDGTLMGVFDGVGGWASEGIDPRDYSYTLSEGSKIATDNKKIRDPLEVLRFAYDHAKYTVGSSTACIVAIDGNNLIASNLGDSGVRIIRNGEVIFASQSQQHKFNLPYQLGTESDDTPDSAEILKCTLQGEDIIVLGTDGLFDNMYDGDIIKVIQKLDKQASVTSLANAIALHAYQISKKIGVNIPFNDMATKWYGIQNWDSGKQDDITVIVVKYRTQ